jgi:hypothetical protein
MGAPCKYRYDLRSRPPRQEEDGHKSLNKRDSGALGKARARELRLGAHRGHFPNPDNRKLRSLACRGTTSAMTTVLTCLSTIIYRELTHRIAGQGIHSADWSAVGLRREGILLGYDRPLDVVHAHDRNSGSAASRLLAELRVLRERQARSSCEGLPGIWRQVVRPPIWRLRSYAQADQQMPRSRGAFEGSGFLLLQG